LDGAALQMQTKGEIRFNLDRGNWVSVGRRRAADADADQGYLRLCVRGETIDCDTQDIASVAINQGVFKVKRVDAKEGWFSSKGSFPSTYNSWPNARLFCFVVDKRPGVKIRGGTTVYKPAPADLHTAEPRKAESMTSGR